MMRIRTKIILLVLPIMVATVVLVGVSSYFSASAGINRITRDFLGFKVYELRKYAESQYQLLSDNNYTDRPAMVQATKGGIDVFASSLLQSPTEIIFSIGQDGKLISSTSQLTLKGNEGSMLVGQLKAQPDKLLNPQLGGIARVAKGFLFVPYNYYYVVCDTNAAFYSDIAAIGIQTVSILVAALLLAIVLLVFFASTLTRPLVSIVNSMKGIIASDDLSKKVEVEFNDETGELAHTFNIMTGELDKAWKEIKGYALQAALAQKKEQRIRTIFQKYVPQEVISQLETSSDSSLVGENQVLSILFSDIRGFTSISEKMNPYDLVQSLNRYFSTQVDIIMKRQGTVDKYIGDAIMAFWGAPIKRDDDAYQSVLAALEMNEALAHFNQDQLAHDRPPFKIGIGLNYGVVTVGNMGSEKKLNYTIIGDNVNLGSRMEGLTKEYHQSLLVSESIVYKIKDKLPTRFLDTVAVKGKETGVRIYTTARSLEPAIQAGWDLHNKAMDGYYQRNFKEAIRLLDQAEVHLPGDFNIEMIRTECRHLLANPPGKDWDGIRVMDHK